MSGGTVVGLHLCVGHKAPMKGVDRAEAQADYGIQGDRHARAGNARQVLIVEQETLDALGLSAGTVRENITTRGVTLRGLVAGIRLRVGQAVLEVTGPCQPCARMDEIRAGLRGELEGRRGTLCRVTQGGVVCLGDRVAVERGGSSEPA